jgi:hypothetical protein
MGRRQGFTIKKALTVLRKSIDRRYDSSRGVGGHPVIIKLDRRLAGQGFKSDWNYALEGQKPHAFFIADSIPPSAILSVREFISSKKGTRVKTKRY